MAKKVIRKVYDFNIGDQDPMQVNVRRDAADGSLRPVGRPSTVGVVPGEILGMVDTSAGEKIVSTCEGEVYVTDCQSQSSVKVAEDDMDFTSSVETGGCLWLTAHLSGRSPARLDVEPATGKVTVAGRLDRRYAPRLSRVDGGAITRPLPERTLKGTYSRTSLMLNADDLHALTADYATAYRDVCHLAASSGRYIQPVIARVTARDAGGMMVYRSAPVMISPASGAQLLRISRPLSGSGLNAAGAVSLQAVPFSIGVSFPAGFAEAWGKVVASVEVEISVQLHPVNLGLLSEARIEQPASDEPVLTLSAPGVAVAAGGIARDGSEMRRRVEAVISCIDDDALIVARTISWDKDGTPADVTGVYGAATADCDSQLAALERMKSTATAGDDEAAICRVLNYPHSFSAACGGVSGDKVLWGGITSRLFDGYTACELAVDHSPAGAGAVMTTIVTLADGRRLVNTMPAAGTVPSGLSPLIIYPHPSAVRISVIAGGKKWESGLRPSACRTLAWCLADDLCPVPLMADAGDGTLPSGDEVITHYPGKVVLAPAAAPLEVEATVTVGSGTVTAVTAQMRSGSTLDVRRHHFYVFSRAGIHAVTAGSAGKVLATVRLDHRPVMSGQSVAEGADGVFAVAGGDLVKVSGNKVMLLIAGVGSCTVGRCGRYGELWLAGVSDDPVTVYNPTTQYCFYRTDVAPERIIARGENLLLHLPDGMLLDASQETAGDTEVAITFRQCLKRAEAVKAMGIRLYGSHVKGKVILAADNGIHSPDGAYRIVDFDINGALNRPLESRVVAARYRYVTLGVRATVAADTRLESAWFVTG